jgi:hypothetical protein
LTIRILTMFCLGAITRLNKVRAMTLVGLANDGFPIYARYGYSKADDAASAIKTMVGSFAKKVASDAGRPAVSIFPIFPMGTFTQGYEFIAGSGDLDECNGRTGVTPDFPSGIHHDYITESYPYLQRCVKGPL